MQDAESGSGARYHPSTVEHFQQPRNVGRLADATHIGRVDDRATETTITLYLKETNGIVQEARFRALACSACIAACSVATVWLTGRPTREAASLDGPTVDGLLGGLPAEKRYCLDLVVQALAKALER